MQFSILTTLSDAFFTITFKNNKEVMEHAIKMHNDYLATLKEADIEGDFTIQDMIQPIPKFFADHGIEKGGNMLGLDRFDDNLIRKHPFPFPFPLSLPL
jgi:hypothetical protein